eukprot:gene10879-22718_t
MSAIIDEYDSAMASLSQIGLQKGLSDQELLVLERTINNIRPDSEAEKSLKVRILANGFLESSLPWQPQGPVVLDMTKQWHFTTKGLSEEEMEQIQLLIPIYSSLVRDILLVMRGKSILEQAMLFGEFVAHAARLDVGGILRDNDAEMESHMSFLSQFLAKESEEQDGGKYRFHKPGVDAVAFGNKCSRPVDELEAVTLTGLKSHCVNKGKVLWVTTIAPAFRVSGVVLLVEDADGRNVTVTLYNIVDENVNISDCQHLFPEGTRIGIKDPYLKCFTTGYLGIRVDHVCNVERPDGHPVSLLLSTNIIRPAVMDVNDIKSKGN